MLILILGLVVSITLGILIVVNIIWRCSKKYPCFDISGPIIPSAVFVEVVP